MRGFVVELSDGQIVSEENHSWLDLKDYLQKNKHLRIARMHLQFDNQQVFLPNYARVYFYSKRVEAYLGASHSQKHQYGIGASTNGADKVTITWYDGKNGKEEVRQVSEEKPAFIIVP